MLWVSVVLGAGAGVLGAIAASVVVRDKAKRPKTYRTLFVLFFLLFLGLSNAFIAPKLARHSNVAAFEAGFKENPAFVALHEYDRPTYDQLFAEAKGAVSEGMTSDQLTSLMRDRVAALLQTKIGKTSDEAAVQVAVIAHKQMLHFQRRGQGVCFDYIFPKPGQPSLAAKYGDPRSIREELDAMALVIKDSAVRPQSEPTAEQVNPAFQSIAGYLAQRYKQEDLQMLQDPHGLHVDKEKVCAISIDMYGRIFELPLDQKGPLLRFILKATAPL